MYARCDIKPQGFAEEQYVYPKQDLSFANTIQLIDFKVSR